MNATLLVTHVPSTRAPEYKISDGVNLLPLNSLSEIKKPWKRYVVIGAGKTGIDAILHLFENNVDVTKISWIVSNECWYFNRDIFINLRRFAKQLQPIIDAQISAKDVNEAYLRLEEIGYFMRLTKDIWPTKMRAATISTKEMETIRTITNIIRLGRIDRIENDAIIFEQGATLPTDANTLHIDCSAAGTNFPHVNEKIFSGEYINLLMVQAPQPCTSGAMIAAIELK